MDKAKFYLVLSLISAIISSCNTQQSERTNSVNSQHIDRPVKSTTISYTDTLFDFGTISSGDTVFHKFNFRNTGTNPMHIKDASSMCGCTIPRWPERSIPPGDTGSITVAFSKKDEYGIHKRTVIVKANTIPEYTMLYIKALVK